MTKAPSAASLAERLPDEPRWVDLRGLLLSGRCEVFADSPPEQGCVARSWDFPYAAAAGEPSADVVATAVADRTTRCRSVRDEAHEWHLLASAATAEAIGPYLRGWTRRPVVLHRRQRRVEPSPTAAHLELLPAGLHGAGLSLDHLPSGLRTELEQEWVSHRPTCVALVAGRIAACCYAPLVTESLWDVAIDTLPAHRRQGLAAACFDRLADHLAEQNRRPVWGALAENTASMRLARKLGFVPDADLVSFLAPRKG